MSTKNRPIWLVAVWHGMGSVALRAGQVLRETLSMELIANLPSDEYHDTDRVDVREGLTTIAPPPHHRLFGWRSRDGAGPDLLLFQADAQPAYEGMKLCRSLVELAVSRGCERIVTFAALPTQVDPRQRARVFGVANQRPLLDELRRLQIPLLKQGQITGQNGLLLAAALERQIPALGLLGEIPVIAGGMANPAATARVLEGFARLSGIPVSVERLEHQAAAVQQRLVDLLERVTRGALVVEPPELIPEPTSEPAPESRRSALAQMSSPQRQELEELFTRVATDRSLAVHLKDELDRLGVYRDYEDRFLDLFK